MISPLRYPGGKAKLFNVFVRIIQENSLYDRCYSEPYAGGAGLAIKLLTHGYVRRVELNDIDPAIYSFWTAALRETAAFCRLVDGTPLTVDEWRRQREIYKNADAADPLELGFSAYYLNRTSRSGIIEGSGPIGGYMQSGEWKIDARMNRRGQIKIIESLAKLGDCISLSQEDALDFLKIRLKSPQYFIYLDPPYYIKGRKLYKNFYGHQDHVAIADLLLKHRHGSWVVSYDHVKEIREIYSALPATTYRLHYSAGPRASGEEVMYASDAVRLPVMTGFDLAA